MKKILFIIMASLAFIACDDNDDAQIIDPLNFPTATYNFEGPSTYVEGDDNSTITVTVTLDKPVNNTTNFEVVTNDEAIADRDYSVGSISIPPFATTGTTEIILLENPFPQLSREIQFTVVPSGEFAPLLLSPLTEDSPVFNVAVTDTNPSGLVVLGLDWGPEGEGDLDVVTTYETGDEVSYIATGNHPEVNAIIADSFPDGVYFVSIDLYTVPAEQFDFNIGLSKSNGDVEEFNGTFDTTNLDQYQSFQSGGLGSEVYSLIRIVKEGTNYTFTPIY